jgi:hypothetical protein
VITFYSIRKNSIQFFADKECAITDQKLEGNELTPKIGEFTIEVEGVAYIDEVMTREDYIKDLESKEKTPSIREAILHLRR